MKRQTLKALAALALVAAAPLAMAQAYPTKPVRNIVYRNNLFIGTDGGFAYENTAKMQEADFDYDGFGGGPYGKFLKWNGVRYTTMQEAREKAPIYKHVVQVDNATAFANGALPALLYKRGSLDASRPFAALQAMSRINDRARAAGAAANFSAKIRGGLPMPRLLR